MDTEKEEVVAIVERKAIQEAEVGAEAFQKAKAIAEA